MPPPPPSFLTTFSMTSLDYAALPELMTYAFRHVLGQQTHGVGTVTEFLERHWFELGLAVRVSIQKEILAAKNQAGLGDMVVDAPKWLALLDLPMTTDSSGYTLYPDSTN